MEPDEARPFEIESFKRTSGAEALIYGLFLRHG
jgi:hypothetical protein